MGKWTEEKIRILKERYQEDGPAKIASEFGFSCWAVVAKARRLGIGSTRKNPPKGFEWTKDMIAAVKERYVAEGGEPLAKEFGLAVDTVRRKASRMGLHTIAGHAVAGRERAETNSSFNIHFFDTWTPDMAYVLGFLFAD